MKIPAWSVAFNHGESRWGLDQHRGHDVVPLLVSQLNALFLLVLSCLMQLKWLKRSKWRVYHALPLFTCFALQNLRTHVLHGVFDVWSLSFPHCATFLEEEKKQKHRCSHRWEPTTSWGSQGIWCPSSAPPWTSWAPAWRPSAAGASADSLLGGGSKVGACFFWGGAKENVRNRLMWVDII